jgi:hypothetical protein
LSSQIGFVGKCLGLWDDNFVYTDRKEHGSV